MNELSWLIYWAGAVNYISGWLTAFAIIAFLLCLGLTFWSVVTVDKPIEQKPPRGAFLLYPLFIFLLIVTTLVPSRDTVLAIAASEMGEKVLVSPQAQRVGAALMNWIEDQTKPAPAPREEEDRR